MSPPLTPDGAYIVSLGREPSGLSRCFQDGVFKFEPDGSRRSASPVSLKTSFAKTYATDELRPSADPIPRVQHLPAILGIA